MADYFPIRGTPSVKAMGETGEYDAEAQAMARKAM